VVNTGAVDADAHGSLAQRYKVQGFPTIKLMYADSKGSIKSVDYSGGRSAKEMARWAMAEANKVVMSRLGAPTGSSSSSSGSAGGFYGGSNVVTLDDSNFHSMVSNTDDMWFVEFYAPWCGHCKALKPAWKGLANTMKGKVKVGAVDCTANQQTCSEFGVQGFPTIRFFGENKDKPMEYNGGRDEGDLVNFATEQWTKAQPPPEVRELTDNHIWTDHCVGDGDETKPKQLCLVAFLPHILDSKADGRNKYISMLKDIALLYKERPFSWFWTPGTSQTDLEKNFEVGGYGYPAFIALNPAKGKYATLRSGFETAHVKEFLDSVRRGQEPVVSITGELSKAATVDAWDGTDGAEELEEEFSLEDLGIGGSEEL
jgi:protein disulfide-isomerase A6